MRTCIIKFTKNIREKKMYIRKYKNSFSFILSGNNFNSEDHKLFNKRSCFFFCFGYFAI